VAEFSIRIDERLWLSEAEFPVVELAAQLHAWLDSGATGDFFYESLEDDEPFLLHFGKLEDGWRLTSPWQRHPEPRALDPRPECADFVRRVAAETKARLGLDIASVLAREASKTR
jgi:hypothetical protein